MMWQKRAKTDKVLQLPCMYNEHCSACFTLSFCNNKEELEDPRIQKITVSVSILFINIDYRPAKCLKTDSNGVQFGRKCP